MHVQVYGQFDMNMMIKDGFRPEMKELTHKNMGDKHILGWVCSKMRFQVPYVQTNQPIHNCSPNIQVLGLRELALTNSYSSGTLTVISQL